MSDVCCSLSSVQRRWVILTTSTTRLMLPTMRHLVRLLGVCSSPGSYCYRMRDIRVSVECINLLCQLINVCFADKFIELLEFRGFQVCTKISYSLYLVQFPIFFYNVGILRAPLFFRLIPIFVDIDEYIVIFLVSILLTLCVEMPFCNLKTLLLDGKKSTSTRLVKANGIEIKKFEWKEIHNLIVNF